MPATTSRQTSAAAVNAASGSIFSSGAAALRSSWASAAFRSARSLSPTPASHSRGGSWQNRDQNSTPVVFWSSILLEGGDPLVAERRFNAARIVVIALRRSL